MMASLRDAALCRFLCETEVPTFCCSPTSNDNNKATPTKMHCHLVFVKWGNFAGFKTTTWRWSFVKTASFRQIKMKSWQRILFSYFKQIHDMSRKQVTVSMSNICGGEIQHVVVSGVERFQPYLAPSSHFSHNLGQLQHRAQNCRNSTVVDWGRDWWDKFSGVASHPTLLTRWLQLMRPPPPFKQHLDMDFPLGQCRNATPSSESAHSIWGIYLPSIANFQFIIWPKIW